MILSHLRYFWCELKSMFIKLVYDHLVLMNIYLLSMSSLTAIRSLPDFKCFVFVDKLMHEIKKYDQE